MSTKTWTGETGQNACQVLLYDSTYIYAGLGTHPALVIKINPLTMTTEATWQADSGQNVCYGLASDGTYIYAGLQTSPARVIKIDPADMSTIATWVGALGQDYCGDLIFKSPHLCVGLVTSPAQIVQIDPETMSTVAIWTGAAGQNFCWSLTADSFLYAGLYISPAQVIKINLSTMTSVAIWTGAENQDLCFCLTLKDSYLYCGLWISPAQVAKIDTSDMTTTLTWIGDSGQNRCADLIFSSIYLCAGLSTTPAQLIRIDSSDMTTESSWGGSSGEDDCRSVLFDDTSTYLGLATSPAQILGILSDSELASIFPQSCRLHLSIRLGNILWSGLVDQDSFEAAVLEVAYNNASGEPLDPTAYLAPYLILRNPPSNSVQGTVKGFVKISSVTIDSPTEGTFYFLYPKALNWEDDDVLQILDYIPLYSRPLVHSGYWDDARPAPIFGPHRMGYINEALEFVGEDSYARKGRTITNYSWTFNDGTPGFRAIAGTRDDPINVSWSTKGEYIVELMVTDSAGKSFTSYRSVLIYERTGDDAPYDAFRLRSLSGDWDSGSFSCSVEVYKSPTLADFPDHALVIILAEEWYGDYKASLGDELGAEDHLFVGYIVAGSQTLDAQTETVTLEIATVDYLMDRLNVWPESFKDGDSFEIAQDSTQFVDLTLDDVAFHILEEHTTVKEIHDIHCSISNRIDYIPINPATLSSVLNDQIFNIRFGKCAATRLSNLYIAQDRQYEPPAVQEAHAFKMTLGKDRWLDSLDLGEERAPDQVCQLGLTAFTRGLQPVVSYAPPLDPNWPAEGNWGGAESITEILVDDVDSLKKVAEADYFAGQALALRNIRYSMIQVQAANWRILDPARQDYFKLDMEPGDTLRAHDWSEERLICRGLEWESIPIQTIEGEPLVQGVPGGHVALDPSLSLDQALKDVMLIAQYQDNNVRAFFTQGLNADSINWTEFSDGLESNVAYDLVQDPFNKYRVLYLGSYNALYLWHAPFGYKGATWDNILTLSQFNDAIGGNVGWYSAVRIEISERKQGFVAIHAVYPHPDDPSTYLQSRVLISLDWGESWEASDPFSYGGSSKQYYPGFPGVRHFCLNDLDGYRHPDGILYAAVGRIKPGDWHSVAYKSTGWSVNFSQAGTAYASPTLASSKGAIHVPYHDNPNGARVFWLFSEDVEATAPYVLKSLDGGANWYTYAWVSPRTVRQARVMDTHEKDRDVTIIYHGKLNGSSGFYFAEDGGYAWTFREVCNGIAGTELGQGILCDVKLWAVDPEVILASGETFLRVSTDEGQNWVDKIGDLEERLHSGCRILKILANWGAQL